MIRALLVCLAVTVSAPAATVETSATPKTRIYVRTVPQGAQITVDGKVLGPSDSLFLVSPGVRKITIEMEGFDPETQEVDVKEGWVKRIVVKLKKSKTAKPPASDSSEDPSAISFRRPGPPRSLFVEREGLSFRPISKTTFVAAYDDGSAEGKWSLNGSGHAVRFHAQTSKLVKHLDVVGVEIFASRYGHREPPEENFHVYLLDEKNRVIKDVPVPYAKIERTGDLQWYKIPVPKTRVPNRFSVALSFNPHQTKGVYLGYDTSVKHAHSYTGLPKKGFTAVDEEYNWMVRVHLTPTLQIGATKQESGVGAGVSNPLRSSINAPARSGDEQKLAIFYLRHLPADKALDTVKRLINDPLGKMKVVADSRLNALLVNCPKKELAAVSGLLRKLDEPAAHKPAGISKGAGSKRSHGGSQAPSGYRWRSELPAKPTAEPEKPDPFAAPPPDPKVQKRGHEILKRMGRVNRYWLYGPPKAVKSYAFLYLLGDNQPKTYKVDDASKVQGAPRQGTTFYSLMHILADEPDDVTFHKIVENAETITLEYAFDEPTKCAYGNGISGTWLGYFSLPADRGTLVLDTKTFTPRVHLMGKVKETYSDFVKINTGATYRGRPAAGSVAYAPKRIRIGLFEETKAFRGQPGALRSSKLVFEWRFAVHEPGLWLLAEAKKGSGDNKPELVVTVALIRLNGKKIDDVNLVTE